MKSFKASAKYLFITAICIAAITPLHAQFQDSATGSRALSGRGIIPLKNQERETPVTNNITEVTQVVQPNTFVASGSGLGYNSAQAYAACGGGNVLLGGGGSCSNGQGLVSIATSQPNGNGWLIACGAGFQDGMVQATAYATCSAN